jgi:hypothetical protein
MGRAHPTRGPRGVCDHESARSGCTGSKAAYAANGLLPALVTRGATAWPHGAEVRLLGEGSGLHQFSSDFVLAKGLARAGQASAAPALSIPDPQHERR